LKKLGRLEGFPRVPLQWVEMAGSTVLEQATGGLLFSCAQLSLSEIAAEILCLDLLWEAHWKLSNWAHETDGTHSCQ